MAHVSVRHALTTAEFDFCRVFCAFGETNAAEAYRRSHCVQQGASYYEKDDDGKPVGSALSPKQASKQASLLLGREHIKAFLEELRNPTGDHARETLADQVLFSEDEGQRLKAAQRILDDEDKLGFRDASDAWAERMSAIGVEVVVPAPGGGEVSFPLREMFPRYSAALPPPDVLVKTMKSLDQYLWLCLGRESGEERDPANWRFLAGYEDFASRNQR